MRVHPIPGNGVATQGEQLSCNSPTNSPRETGAVISDRARLSDEN
jgi:hypothetical protein